MNDEIPMYVVWGKSFLDIRPYAHRTYDNRVLADNYFDRHAGKMGHGEWLCILAIWFDRKSGVVRTKQIRLDIGEGEDDE